MVTVKPKWDRPYCSGLKWNYVPFTPWWAKGIIHFQKKEKKAQEKHMTIFFAGYSMTFML